MRGRLLVDAPEYAHLLLDWDPANERPLPTITAHCGYRAQWICHLCGHAWVASVANRAAGRRCPECARAPVGQRLSNLPEFAHLVAEWHEDNDRTPFQEHPGSYYRAKWRCVRCGHVWDTRINTRTRLGAGCPVCAYRPSPEESLAGDPELSDLVLEWHEGNDLTPADVRPGSHYEALWRCSDCGHVWRATVDRRVNRGSGCDRCNRHKPERLLHVLRPDLVDEWDTAKNELAISDVTVGSCYRAWWRCRDCGHSWRVRVYLRATGTSGCPSCNRPGWHEDSAKTLIRSIGVDALSEMSRAEVLAAVQTTGILVSSSRARLLIEALCNDGLTSGLIDPDHLKAWAEGQENGCDSVRAVLDDGRSRFHRIGIPAAERRAILDRDGCCQLCEGTEGLVIDHFWPLTWGGAHHRSNYWTLCDHCNSVKGANVPTLAMFDRWLERYGSPPPSMPPRIRAEAGRLAEARAIMQRVAGLASS